MAPADGSVIDDTSVTLQWQAIAGYSGRYWLRVHEANWDGQQAVGVNNDCSPHYVCMSTTQTQVSIPVDRGGEYVWWVHRAGDADFSKAAFTVAPEPVPAPDPDPAPDPEPPPAEVTIPQVVYPAEGAVIEGPSVRLEFTPVTDYQGNYLVRLHDKQWDGTQAAGFDNDCTRHYLCITTDATQIDVPVETGTDYVWWVHTPGGTATSANFSVKGLPPGTIPDSIPANQVAAPELIEGRYRCTSLESWSGQDVDVSPALQGCIDQTPTGGTLELPVGEYYVNSQTRVERRMTITSVGKSAGDPTCDDTGNDCAELIATSALNETGGMLRAIGQVNLQHIVLDGNKSGRVRTEAADRCSRERAHGFNALFDGNDFVVEGSVVKNAICGAGLVVNAGYSNVDIRNNRFVDNGTHNQRGMWADGLTIAELSASRIVDNVFEDNTDIDFILGGCRDCVVQRNEIRHTSDPAGGSFAALMLYDWPNSSGDFTGSDFSANVIDCGPGRQCGSGIYIGTEGWSDGTVTGATADGQVSAAIHGNSVSRALNGMYVASQRFSIFENPFSEAHGQPIPASCGTLRSDGPIVVSPAANNNDFRGENTDPQTSNLFDQRNWAGCIPNWPF